MSPANAEPDARTLKAGIVEFIRDASVEITTHDERALTDLQSLLLPGTVVYVAHTPKASLADVVDTACRAQAAGFRACPHIAARRLPDAAALRSALRRLEDAGCERVLLVAGDPPTSIGPFTSTLDILDSGIAADCGIQFFGVAGHPEGHRHVAADELWRALEVKQRFARQSGKSVYVLTQFSFDAPRVIAWGRELLEHGIRLPVHVGVAGPAPLDKLVRYAVLCGIGSSLRAAVTDRNLVANLRKAARSVDQVVAFLVRARGQAHENNLVAPHFYPFGGTLEAARWLKAVREGRFDLETDGTGFAIRDR